MQRNRNKLRRKACYNSSIEIAEILSYKVAAKIKKYTMYCVCTKGT
ncbi:hypothetical protein [Clostridium botulinum]|nr:hypothetical protein [Clostridium botulinum]